MDGQGASILPIQNPSDIRGGAPEQVNVVEAICDEPAFFRVKGKGVDRRKAVFEGEA